MKEVWKDIYFVDNGIEYDYRGIYQISNLGRVKSLPRKGTIKIERILAGKYDRYNYRCIDLYKEGKIKTFKIHRLVAWMFLPNDNKLPEVNHKNKIRDQNIVDVDDLYGDSTNLEWCTNQYNVQYSKARKVMQYDKNNNFIKEWDCIRAAGRALNVCNSDIIRCCRGKYKTVGGYVWRYSD